MAVLFDLENILTEFSDEMQKNIRFIYSLSLIPKPKVSFHAADADGVISAVILKTLEEFQNAIFIPLGYQEIRHPEFGKFLQALNWAAIVDLPPFNESSIALYSDHHLTNKGLSKIAEVVLFDENAPSAASLLAKYFNKRLPDSLKLLADLTTITDTANFTIPPPTDFPPSFIEATRQEQAWLLDDLCRTPESAEEVLKLVQDFTIQEFEIFKSEVYHKRIVDLRNLRKESIKLGEDFEIKDVIVIIQGKMKILTSALVHSLFEKGAKITCVFYPGKRFTGLSFRVNSQIPEFELEQFRVDHIAGRFSGGGHPRAAGGRGTSFKSTMKEVIDWIEQKDFSYRVYDLRKTPMEES